MTLALNPPSSLFLLGVYLLESFTVTALQVFLQNRSASVCDLCVFCVCIRAVKPWMSPCDPLAGLCKLRSLTRDWGKTCLQVECKHLGNVRTCLQLALCEKSKATLGSVVVCMCVCVLVVSDLNIYSCGFVFY